MSGTPRWKDGSKGMLTVNALFAGFSGVLLGNVIREQGEQGGMFYASAGFALVALYLFAVAAERITDALDENKVNKYISSMFLYNIGVIAILLSVSALLWSKDRQPLAYLALAGTFWPWGKDFLTLSICKAERDKYRELLLTVDP